MHLVLYQPVQISLGKLSEKSTSWRSERLSEASGHSGPSVEQTRPCSWPYWGKGRNTPEKNFQRIVATKGPRKHFAEESGARRRRAVDGEGAGQRLPSVANIIVSCSSRGGRSHRVQPRHTPLAPESAVSTSRAQERARVYLCPENKASRRAPGSHYRAEPTLQACF